MTSVREVLSFQKLRRPRYLPISPIVKWDPPRHHFSGERHHSTAHCVRTAGTIEDLPNVILNPETRDSPAGAVPGTWVFSRTWRHSGTFRGNFIGRGTRSGRRCQVRERIVSFNISCFLCRQFIRLRPSFLFFTSYITHYVVEIRSVEMRSAQTYDSFNFITSFAIYMNVWGIRRNWRRMIICVKYKIYICRCSNCICNYIINLY